MLEISNEYEIQWCSKSPKWDIYEYQAVSYGYKLSLPSGTSSGPSCRLPFPISFRKGWLRRKVLLRASWKSSLTMPSWRFRGTLWAFEKIWRNINKNHWVCFYCSLKHIFCFLFSFFLCGCLRMKNMCLSNEHHGSSHQNHAFTNALIREMIPSGNLT